MKKFHHQNLSWCYPNIVNLLKFVYPILRKLDIEISRNVSRRFPVEVSRNEIDIFAKVAPITMTSTGRLSGVGLAMRYLKVNEISGDIVECGVWAGGSIGAAALLGEDDPIERKYWLFDTFEGMTRPSVNDPVSAIKGYENSKHSDGEGSSWCEVNEIQVKKNLADIGVDLDSCSFVAGDVAITLHGSNLPKNIALLRLDTDWYESTLVELEILFPRIVRGGVLIIDDYGHWEGARKAVDEYFGDLDFKPLMIPLDYTGRIGIKL
jgi:hypothetical protein